jgi:hypothetical protein
VPRSKADAVTGWSSAEHQDDGQKEETDEHDDFDAGEPELGFGEDADW